VLDPRNRTLLLEHLRPPEGFSFDCAVGTSFSLDLLALLTTPLAFTLFDWEDDSGSINTDPLAILGAVRSHAERILIFSQAGQICLPPAAQPLTAYLEQSVYEVEAPKGGVFHPKVWAVRYKHEGGSAHIRFLCLSRNLTFDRSWDLALTLDGEVIDRDRAFGENNALGEFFAALPALATKKRKMPDASRTLVTELAEQLRKVKWNLPDGVESLKFWPLGLSNRRQWPFEEVSSRPVLVVSPFLKDRTLERIAENRDPAVLISRPDELARLKPKTLAAFASVYAFDLPTGEGVEEGNDLEATRLSGLHAKAYAFDDGWGARMFVGSANATNAAFGSNVEFLTELRGKRSDLGIDALLVPAENGEVTLASMLQPWSSKNSGTEAGDEAAEKLESELERLCCQIAAKLLRVRVVQRQDALFDLELNSTSPLSDFKGAKVQCWPSTLRIDHAINLKSESVVKGVFRGLSLEALTGFFAIEASITAGGKSASKRFACVVELIDVPKDRLARLLSSMLSDKGKLMRFIWLLLEAQGGLAGSGAFRSFTEGAWSAYGSDEYPIFERVLRALVTDSARLSEVGRVIEELSSTHDGAKVVPFALRQIWAAIQQYRGASS